MSGRLRPLLSRVAREGVLAWSLFGLVEQLLGWHTPALYGAGSSFTSGHWRYGLCLALLYPLSGAALATLLALIAHLLLRSNPGWLHQRAPRAIAVLPLALASGLVCFDLRGRPTALLLLALSGLLAAACLLVIALPRWSRPLGFLVNAPTAAAWLLLPGWVVLELLDRPSSLQAGAVTLLAAVAIGMVAFLAQVKRSAARSGHEPRPDSLPLGGLGSLLAAWLLMALVSWWRLDRAPNMLATIEAHATSAQGPNVVLIVLDTVRADHTSLYGYARATTPRLESLARESVVFEDAVAPGDMTLSSHASLFTGLYARSHGAHFDERGQGRPLQPDFRTLAEILHDAGWLTLGVAANHVFFGRGFGLEQGFQAFDARPPDEYLLLHEAGRLPWFTLGRSLHRSFARAAPARAELRHYRKAEQVIEEGLGMIDAAAVAGRPLFLLLNLMDAHWPYVPPPPFDQRFAGFDPRFDDMAWRSALVDQVIEGRERDVAADERAHMESQYDGAIAYMDAEVGRLIDHLKLRGLWEDTLLVVTSDHGEAFGERQLVGHALSVYQDQVHVPLLIKAPGARQGRRVPWTASLIDVLPTVVATLGLEVPAGLQGRDLLAAEAPARPPVVAAESFPNPALGGPRLDRVQRALRLGALKLIRSSTAPDEVYDLAADPSEGHAIGGAAVVLPDLSRLLEDWLQAVPPAEAGAALTDEATLERLRRLGY